MYKILQHNDLIKRGPDRLRRFISKIGDESPFSTIHGEVIIKKSCLHLSKLYDIMQESKFKYTFECLKNDIDINVKYPNEFYKTEDFGGKGKGAGTKAEDFYLENFKECLYNTLSMYNVKYLPFNIGNRYMTVSNIVSTPNTGLRRAPKSDFTLLDKTGRHVGWLSHKAGNSPSHFQQYGGLSDIFFSEIKEVNDFIYSLKNKFSEGLKSGIGVYRKVNDNMVIMKSIYGLDFGKERGVNNTDEFHQGFINIIKDKTEFKLTSNHYGKNGDILTGGYTPIYYARYTSDRGANVGGHFIPNARIGVFPIGKAPKSTLEI